MKLPILTLNDPSIHLKKEAALALRWAYARADRAI